MVAIDELELTNLQQKILRLLFIRAGDKLNAHTVAKALKVSQPAVSKALPALQENELIMVSKDNESKRLSIELNRDLHNVIWLKRADNLLQLYESGLVQCFYDKLPEATIIVFGSYSLGEDTSRSDIDIAIIGSLKKDIKLEQFETKLGRLITINHYKSFKNIEKHLLNNILNGIILKGGVEL